MLNADKSAASFAAVATLIGTGAAAQPGMEEWAAMAREVAPAATLIGSQVSNGVTPMGIVTDLVLSEDGSDVLYFVYDVPYPYALWGTEGGLVGFDEAVLERGVGAGLEVRFDPEQAAQPPEDLDLSADEADTRLASRLLGGKLDFASGEQREITNLLIDRRTGAVRYYVIEADPAAVFRQRRRAVPAQRVDAEDGRVATLLRLDQLDELQHYDPALL